MVDWATRAANREAGALANGGTIAFDPSKMLAVSINSARWEVPAVLKLELTRRTRREVRTLGV